MSSLIITEILGQKPKEMIYNGEVLSIEGLHSSLNIPVLTAETKLPEGLGIVETIHPMSFQGVVNGGSFRLGGFRQVRMLASIERDYPVSNSLKKMLVAGDFPAVEIVSNTHNPQRGHLLYNPNNGSFALTTVAALAVSGPIDHDYQLIFENLVDLAKVDDSASKIKRVVVKCGQIDARRFVPEFRGKLLMEFAKLLKR